jgi:hypothetical protein
VSAAQVDDALVTLLKEWAQALAAARRESLIRFAPGGRWSTLAFTNRHLRRQSDALLRSLSLRIALDPADTEAAASRERLQSFRESLAPGPSRWIIVAVVILIGLLVQLVVTSAARHGFGDEFSSLSDVFGKSATGDPSSIVELGGKLLIGRSVDRLVFLTAASLVGYLVLRGPARGFEQAQRLLAAAGANALRSETLGLSRTSDFPFDLAVKALLAIGLLGWGALTVVAYQTSIGFHGYTGSAVYVGAAIGLLGLVRLAQIGVKWTRTRYGLMPFLGACVFVAVILLSAEISAHYRYF